MQQRAIMGTALALALLLLAGLGIAIVLAPTPQYAANELDPPTAPTWGRPAEPPTRATIAARPGIAGLVDADWLAATAERTGIPERALASYAGAAISKADNMPSCGLAWNTLAAIGFAESRHGTFGGSSVGEDGTVTPPIFGVSLAGGATEHIPDSDQGTIDGDPEFDRAVGPMQLIPQTWRNWHGEGSGDGVEDPQNLDDAVTSTAAYLCYASGDMASEAGWRSGIAAFNSAESYLRVVAQAADDYR
jgi:membrane-bound lytic murein transglycosylase B